MTLSVLVSEVQNLFSGFYQYYCDIGTVHEYDEVDPVAFTTRGKLSIHSHQRKGYPQNEDIRRGSPSKDDSSKSSKNPWRRESSLVMVKRRIFHLGNANL